MNAILVDLGIAAAAFLLGYIVYRAGQLGLGDVMEMCVISLLLPFQNFPMLALLYQYNIPFIIAVAIAAGIAALVIVPIYYLPRTERELAEKITSMVSKKDVFKSALISISYIVLIGMLVIAHIISLYGVIVLGAVLLGSAFTILFEKPITQSMIRYVDASSFEEGDIIAFNLMDAAHVEALKVKVNSFGKLVTRDMIDEMKANNIADKLPVYKLGIPFAVPIFIAVVISLLFGNLIILIL
ncbi:peptidase A24A prepilin type IV [mine drainage metagenome]|uniref:Peptidase A24A prepilin type IV n=1 Tax=mine drainage metagenome TaxID=410659 RepID=T0Z407_9ZZZZ